MNPSIANSLIKDCVRRLRMVDKMAIARAPWLYECMTARKAQSRGDPDNPPVSNSARRARQALPSLLAGALLAFVLAGCGESHAKDTGTWKTMEVTATSFTLAEDETKDGDVGLSASGHVLKPTSKAIAVSRDLFKNGLSFGTKVQIENLPGTYIVRDKMNRRWRDKIDILFARKKRALQFGRKTVTIRYQAAGAN